MVEGVLEERNVFEVEGVVESNVTMGRGQFPNRVNSNQPYGRRLLLQTFLGRIVRAGVRGRGFGWRAFLYV